MKFNWNLNDPRFEVSESERMEIEEFKKELLTFLDYHRETEKEDLETEIENVYNLPTILEILEKERIEIKNNRAFSTEYYEEKCFYIDENGMARITDNEQLLFRFYHAFAQKSKFNARAIAGNIIKVRLIEYMAKIIAKSDKGRILFPPVSHKTKKEYTHYIFSDRRTEEFFEYLFKKWLINLNKPLGQISYIFRCFWDEETSEIRDSYFSIHSKQNKFAEYWNKNYQPKHLHQYKLPLKENNTISFKTETELKAGKHQTKYETLKKEFLTKNPQKDPN